VTFREVARAWYLEPQSLASNVDASGLDVAAGYRAKRDSGTFSYATHAAMSIELCDLPLSPQRIANAIEAVRVTRTD
jgi:hypothetical protein